MEGGRGVSVVQGRGERRRVEGAGRRGQALARALRVAVLTAALAAGVAVLGVRLGVLGEVVGAHEALVADGAGEPLLAGVGAQVALQLVRAGEPLAAEQPVAHEWSLARVPPQVGLQVRRLAVDLTAAGDVTVVDVFLLEVGGCGPEALGLLAVGTVTGGTAGVAPLGAR